MSKVTQLIKRHRPDLNSGPKLLSFFHHVTEQRVLLLQYSFRPRRGVQVGGVGR